MSWGVGQRQGLLKSHTLAAWLWTSISVFVWWGSNCAWAKMKKDVRKVAKTKRKLKACFSWVKPGLAEVFCKTVYWSLPSILCINHGSHCWVHIIQVLMWDLPFDFLFAVFWKVGLLTVNVGEFSKCFCIEIGVSCWDRASPVLQSESPPFKRWACECLLSETAVSASQSQQVVSSCWCQCGDTVPERKEILLTVICRTRNHGWVKSPLLCTDCLTILRPPTGTLKTLSHQPWGLHILQMRKPRLVNFKTGSLDRHQHKNVVLTEA